MWRVKWRNWRTGVSGCGEPVYQTERGCLFACEAFNKEDPDLIHEPELAVTEEIDEPIIVDSNRQ